MPPKVDLFLAPPTYKIVSSRDCVCVSLLDDIVDDVMRISAAASLIEELSITAIEKANSVASIIKKKNQAKLSGPKDHSNKCPPKTKAASLPLPSKRPNTKRNKRQNSNSTPRPDVYSSASTQEDNKKLDQRFMKLLLDSGVMANGSSL